MCDERRHLLAQGRKNVEVECFTDSVGDFAWQGANPFAASAPVEVRRRLTKAFSDDSWLWSTGADPLAQWRTSAWRLCTPFASSSSIPGPPPPPLLSRITDVELCSCARIPMKA